MNSGGVVQGIERRITNPAVASSKLAPATILKNNNGCPVLLALGNRNRQTREGSADYTWQGNRHYTPSWASVKGGPVNILKKKRSSPLSPLSLKAVRSALLCA